MNYSFQCLETYAKRHGFEWRPVLYAEIYTDDCQCCDCGTMCSGEPVADINTDNHDVTVAVCSYAAGQLCLPTEHGR